MPIEERNGETIYVSRVRLVQKPDKIRDAHIEGFDEPLTFGVHEGIRRVYGLPTGAEIKDEHPATLDHLVAALAG